MKNMNVRIGKRLEKMYKNVPDRGGCEMLFPITVQEAKN